MMNNSYGTAREQSMEELRKMYTYFSKKKAAYDEFDRLDKLICEQSKPIKKRGKTWGILLSIVGGVLLLASYSGTVMTGTPIMGLIFLGIGILLISSHSSKTKNRQKTLQDATKRMEELAQELTIHYNKYGYCQLGLEYTFPHTIESIYETIRLGRADTIKDAVNLLINDERMSEMERLQRETAQAAWKTCAATRATAGFAAANYFRGR